MVELRVLVDAIACGDGGDGSEARREEVVFAPFEAPFELGCGIVVFVVGRGGFRWWGIGAADGAAGADFGFSAAAGGGCGGVTVGGRR